MPSTGNAIEAFADVGGAFFQQVIHSFAARRALSARIIVFTGPIEAGAIDSERKPSAIKASASTGRLAISPAQRQRHLVLLRRLHQSPRARSGLGDNGS